MSILQKNLISNNGPLKKNMFGEPEPNIFFHNDIKSTDIPQYYFTNYIDSSKSPMINFLKTERRRFLKKQVDIDQEYEIKDIKKTKEQNKIDKILMDTLNMTSIPILTLFRLKSKYNPGVQFFFLDDLNGNYQVLFIDIYHLVLPAPDKSHGEKFSNPKKKYNEHKLARYCISNIFHK